MLWIGGAPGTGKTTVAKRLARRYGLRWYNADTRTWVHRDRALAAGNEAARRWEELPPAERGNAPPDELLAMSLHRERGPMVIDDLRALPRSPLVVAEGSTVPASAVSTGVADRTRAVWLIPTLDFQRALLERRGTSPQAAQLWLLLAEVIAGEAAEHGAPIFRVDGSKGVVETAHEIATLFADALAAGPRAETQSDRRALLREANEAVVAQVRRYFARPWARGDPESIVREFVCECGDPACHEDLQLPVGEVAAGRVFAPGHA